ncbi:MAG: helix-turn-helix domain-containing protein [Myxococcota bacterium]
MTRADEAVQDQVRAARREAYRGAVLSAAERLFAERGFASISMADIAKAAGVAKGTLYNYFDSKEEVFAQLAERARQAYLAEVDAAMEGQTGWACLEAIAAKVLTYLGRDGSMLSMYLEATGDGSTRSEADPGRDDGQLAFARRIGGIMDALERDGQLRDGLPADRLVLIYCGALEAQVRANLADATRSDHATQAAQLIDVLRHGAQHR